MGENCRQELSFSSEAGIHGPPSPTWSDNFKTLLVLIRSYISQNCRYWTGQRIGANRLVQDQSVLVLESLLRRRGWLGVL